MKRCITLLLTFLGVLSMSANGQYFRHLGVSDGLSQVCILSIYQDELGAMWLGTSEGLNRYNGRNVEIFRPSQVNEGLTNNEINEICGDKKGRMYICAGKDLVRFDLYTEQFTCLRRDDVEDLFCNGDTLWVSCRSGIYYYTPDAKELTFVTKIKQEGSNGGELWVDEDTIWVAGWQLLAISRRQPEKQEKVMSMSRAAQCIIKDHSKNIWIGTFNGIYKWGADRKRVFYPSQMAKSNLSGNQIRCVVEDDYQRLWFGGFRGLDCYDPATDEWSHYIRYGNSPNTLSHHSLLSLHKDRSGNIWVGTYYGGVNVFNPSKDSNLFYCAEPLQPDCLSFPVVGKMTEDAEGGVWICTEGGGLNLFDAKKGTFTCYQHQEDNQHTVGSNNLKSIFYHKKNNRLYVGAHYGGLFVLDLKTNKGHTLRPIKGDAASLPHAIVNDIQEFEGGLAVLTQGGVAKMDIETEKFAPISTKPEIKEILSRSYAYETFLIDSKKRIWLASARGGVICIDLPTSKVTRFVADVHNPAAIGRFKVVHIFEDHQGCIFFSTIGSGVFEYVDSTQSFKSYNTTNQVLPSDYCYYISNTFDDNYLFVLHGKGLSVFNRKKEKVEKTYHLYNQTYSQGSALYLSSDSVLYVSGTNGLALFNRRSLQADSPSRNLLAFDKLFIFNEEICPGDETGILTSILAKTQNIDLGYKQNNITVEVATFDYVDNWNQMLEYCLEGFDNSWTQTSNSAITYTNLSPGNYTLRVRPLGVNTKEAEISLRIFVDAPFYATRWAYLFYALCSLGLVFAFIRFKTRQAALRSSLEFERKEKERVEELNQIKLRFFTNISHEFRTPLTLIMGQIEILMQMDLGTTVYNRIQRIYKNAWHMRDLISELLDFRKQEQGYLKLHVEEVEIVSFTRQIFMCFYEYAQHKEMTYTFDALEEKIMVWIDPKQLQKVIFNLLSNAFKYTPDHGTIVLSVRKQASQVIISVQDSGIGIQKEHIAKIFERFYQTEQASSPLTLGTGIGLALAKGIMDLHHGTIEVESAEGQGTKFTLSLLLGNRHFTEEELLTSGHSPVTSVVNVPAFPLDEQLPEEKEQEKIDDSDKPELLLVDDNEELLSMLKEVFMPIYKVHLAHNGREGFEMARQIQPDLIISDVMMPEMSGKELCYKIKNNVELSHISVVLLTAQTSVDYMVEGLMFGADDYVTKPFNVKVLVARCNNLLKNKRRLMAHFSGSLPVDTPVAEVMSEKNRELLSKCMSIVRENFSNPEFDVNMLASELCIGRSKLYAEFKQMTGLTPNEFILKMKLEEAMVLLKERPDLNVTDISVQLGFSSSRYFSRSFKAFFGIPPLAYRNMKEE